MTDSMKARLKRAIRESKPEQEAIPMALIDPEILNMLLVRPVVQGLKNDGILSENDKAEFKLEFFQDENGWNAELLMTRKPRPGYFLVPNKFRNT